MKKRFLTILTASLLSFSFLSSFELKRAYNNSQRIELSVPYLDDDVKLIEDVTDKDGYSKLVYHVKETEQITFSIEYAQFEKKEVKNPFQILFNIMSLLFPDVEYKNSLQLMKAIRMASKKVDPYSSWKLISAETANDIIFEKKIFDLGAHSKSQEVTRIIKSNSGFFLVSYKIKDDHFSKVESDEFYTSLKEMKFH